MALKPSKALYLALFLCMVLFVTPKAFADMIDMPIVKLQSLDKTTARTLTFEVKVGATVKYGPLYIKVRACRKAPPIEAPESASFLQIWEVTPEETANWVFSGWMFASSPALSAMDHPIYDVWVIDCLEDPALADTQEEIDEDISSDEQTADQSAEQDSEIEE